MRSAVSRMAFASPLSWMGCHSDPWAGAKGCKTTGKRGFAKRASFLATSTDSRGIQRVRRAWGITSTVA